jgi:hypothetical protein
MALTEERLRSGTPVPERTETPVPDAAELEALVDGPRVAQPLGGAVRHHGLAIAWIAVIGSLMAWEPVPADSSVPTWAAVLSTGFLATLVATLVGLASGTRWSLRASAATAGAGIALAAACAQTGHHAGLWWATELAAFTALLALTAAALRRGAA